MFRSRLLSLLLCVAVCLLACRTVNAQKLYLLTGGDLQDKELGSAIEESVFRVASSIETNMPPSYLVRYNDPENAWNGPEIYQSQDVRRDILTAIDRCPAGPNDTIFFYWCGHGAYDVQNGEKKHYLLMPGPEEKTVMYRSEILGALKKKRPRLAVLITDSCNQYKHVPWAVAPAAEPYDILGVSPLYKSLFFQCRGTVDVNSSSPDQQAVVSEEMGSLFSFWLSVFLGSGLDRPTSWKSLFDQIDSQLGSKLEAMASDADHLGSETEDSDYQQTVYRLSLPSQENIASISEDTFREPPGLPDETTYAGTLGFDGDAFPNDESGWSERADWRPENGDRIIAVNGESVRNEAEYREAVKYSPETITLTLIDIRGDLCYLRTRLWPQRGNNTRLGIYIETSPYGGVTVTGLVPGSPAFRCRHKFGDSLPMERDMSDSWSDGWSERADWRPENGDRIIAVNGESVRNEAEYREAVKYSPETITLTLIDIRGDLCYLQTRLWPQRGNNTRLGIYIETSPYGGVTVTGLVPGSPALHCRHKRGN